MGSGRPVPRPPRGRSRGCSTSSPVCGAGRVDFGEDAVCSCGGAIETSNFAELAMLFQDMGKSLRTCTDAPCAESYDRQ